MYSIDYRPQKLEELCGNKDIKKYYNNAFKEKDNFKFPQVSMFISNSPGVGKTTVAKIIAKTLNCHSPVFNEATKVYDSCDNCPSCKAIIKETYDRDCHIYSGATDRTEDLLKIQDLLSYPASYEKNTIILIEEFQALHTQALSTLLHLTEKPRKNVYFIFCSMSAEKSNKEINALKSRSQKFLISLPESVEIVDYLVNILDQQDLLQTLPESFLTEGLATLTSTGGNEGLRGIVQNLERCLLSELFTEEEITKELGLISETTIFKIMDKLINKDKSVVLDLQGTDINSFFNISKSMFLKAMSLKVYNPEQEFGGWKKYSKSNNLEKLIECYLDIQKLNYFQPDVFIFNLCTYLNEVKQVQRLKETVVENKPVQRIPVSRT